MAQPWQSYPAPPGWQGPWPPAPGVPMPPGFPGPPPAPSNVAPSSWQSGFWQFNPRAPGVQGGFQNQAGPTNPNMRWPGSQPSGPGPWAPSNHWGAGRPQQQQQQQPPQQQQQQQQHQQQQQQQQEPVNPYKRVPKAPAPEYYNYKLSDNPLGLEGMVPRNDGPRDPENEEGPQTPWIWNPATLRETDERPVAARDFPRSRSSMDNGPNGQGQGQSSRRASMDGHGRPVYAPVIGASWSGSDAQPPPRSAPLFGETPPTNRPMPPGFMPNPPHQPKPTHAVRKSESFTEKSVLRPTFSPSIVRTPDYYQRKQDDAARQANIYRTPPNSADPSTQMFVPPRPSTAATANVYHDHSPQPQPLGRHATMPSDMSSLSNTMSSMSISTNSSSMVGMSNFTDEPASLLSPLIGATPKAQTGQLARERIGQPMGRSQTLSSIPETLSSSSRLRDIGGLAPLAPPPDNTSPPRPQHQHSRSASRNSTPRRENPLPPPPTDTHRSSPRPQSQAAPTSYNRKVRKGFWNKRGDHLTSDLHVVYAPPDLSYPAELANYPDGREGYYDAFLKSHIPWIDDRPELPASLPQRGRPPTQPYENFVVYGYL